MQKFERESDASDRNTFEKAINVLQLSRIVAANWKAVISGRVQHWQHEALCQQNVTGKLPWTEPSDPE